MNTHGRDININGATVTITDMDYKGFNDRISDVFKITFTVQTNGKQFLIDFSNAPLENQNPSTPAEFKGNGQTYMQFLQELNSAPNYAVSKSAEDAANSIIGAIAQSVYYDVRSHSPDQDEE
ncbi:MAG: hypothetical protein WC733_04130 [Methylophilus sp.]